MRNSPGMLVEADRSKPVEIEDDINASWELEKFRYRSDRFLDRETNNLTSYRNNQFGAAKPVWKFRPLDEDKDKKVIKIEDQPVRRLLQPQQQLQQQPQLQSQPQQQMQQQTQPQLQPQPQLQAQPQYYRPYSPYMMTPMPIAPVMPYMPIAPMMSPGLMYQYPLYSY